MKKSAKQLIAAVLSFVMVLSVFFTYMPALETKAAEQGRAWYTVTSTVAGSGHNYGNASVSAPVTLLNNDKEMESAGEISFSIVPSNNWGVFYSYVDDNNWLYVGYDGSSQWYYQYNLNGNGSYPTISGLPTPVEGEEMTMSISMDRETLVVTVNGTTARVTNQTLIEYGEATAGNGRFGVKTNNQSSIAIADFKYNNVDCMEDNWSLLAERTGQSFEKTYTAVATASGAITDAETKQPVSGATVRIGTMSTVTDAEGKYTMEGVQIGTYNMSVSMLGYVAATKEIEIAVDSDNVFDVELSKKEALDLTQYDEIATDTMTAYIGKEFPMVARYTIGDTFFRGNEETVNKVVINGVSIEPTVTIGTTTATSKEYKLHLEDAENSLNFDMTVVISVKNNTLTWEVTELKKAEGCAKIATINIPDLNLVTVSAEDTDAVFAGAKASTVTTSKADSYITFEDGFSAMESDAYLYAFLSKNDLSAGIHSNSEAEGDKRVIRNNGADTISLTSAVWYYESGDKAGQAEADIYDYRTSELPYVKVAIAGDLNEDNTIDWNDGAIAYREIYNTPYGSEVIKDMVNYRIVMNFASMAPNPYLATADNIKKVYLATDGLAQSVMLKGYGNEGHDSANSEYADIAEREGGVDDFQDLIEIAHEYNAEIGIHVNAQEIYPEAKSFNEDMLSQPIANGWGWLDQSHVINKLWDLATDARLKRFVQLYDRINETSFYSGDWEEGEYVKDSQGYFQVDGKEVTADEVMEAIKADAANRKDNMDFIYLDVWYQDAWETRRIAEEINSLGWRFTTEFSAEGEYDSTWQHWSTDAAYGGAAMKGYNSDIIRFIRNDQRDSQVLNYPSYGGTADNPLLGGYRLYGFEGWGGDQDFNNYIYQTFNQNLPTKFLQHYQVIKWVNYGDDGSDETSPVGNTEKEITLTNGSGDQVIVTRNEAQRSDSEIERTITLNGKTVLETTTEGSAYLLPWQDEETNEEKLYHWNLEGGETTWALQDGWKNYENVYVYELSDQGRINKTTVEVSDGQITLTAEAATAYIVVKGEQVKTLKEDFGEKDYVADPGFNGYAGEGESLDEAEWSGDIDNEAVTVVKSTLGDQRLTMADPTEDVSVTTTISGLTAGKDYVAEIYVANASDEKATIAVDAGDKVVSNYTTRSYAKNYVQCDNEHSSYMQRIQISFVAESETATLTLSREAGEGTTEWDDIRIVEQKVENFKEDGSFEQDFESVVQGLYPFVLGSAQGVSDPVTHLSQLNAPYTQAGWNGRRIDDVIDGEWSLKHHGANTGIIYQTLPQNFRFEAGKVYTVEFDYQANSAAYAMVIGNGTIYTAPTTYLRASANTGTTEVETVHVTMQVVGAGNGQTWIGLYENGSLAGSGSMGQTDFTLDNLKITEDASAVVVTVDASSLYKGEVSYIYGSGLDRITWEVSNEAVLAIDTDNYVIKAIGAGTATVTATLPDGSKEVFEFVVTDKVMLDFEESELETFEAEANSAQSLSGSEGPAYLAVDGDSSTYWHTAWSGFSVSESNPAYLTVNLGKDMSIDGFKFQQRSSGGSNGMIYKYQYATSEDGTTYTDYSDVYTTANPTTGSWEYVEFPETTTARYIRIKVVEGHNNFAAIAEVLPMKAQKLTEEVTFDVTEKAIAVDESFTITLQYAEGALLKGMVFASSNPKAVSVTESGKVTGLKAGQATITLSNACGVIASCKVVVAGGCTHANGYNEKVGEKAATCTTKGYTGDKVCKDCEEIVEKGTSISLEAHKAVTDEAVAPTCTETGLTEGSHCSVCDTVLVAQEVVKATGHTSVVDEAVAATCTTTGLTEGSHCSVCEEVLKAQEEVPATGHTSVVDEAVAPTCTETGLTEGSHCSVCDTVLVAQEVVKATGHSYKTTTKAATTKANGSKVVKCTVCGDEESTATIYKIKSVTVSDKAYNGKAQKTTVVVKDSKGNKISSKYYTVKYASGRKVVGKYKVTITFKGDYEGTVTKYFKINPKATKLTKATAGKKAISLKWNKVTKQVAGYQIQYATNKSFTKGKKVVTVKKAKITTLTLKKLSAKKTYYVRIRTYKKVSGKTYYSAWSAVKKVKTK